MSARRHAYNIGKIALMAAFSVVFLAVVIIIGFWPLVLHAHYGQPLSVAVALLLVWWAAML